MSVYKRGKGAHWHYYFRVRGVRYRGVISEARTKKQAEQAESKLIRAGANRVVAPTIIGGHRMAMALTKPAVGDFLDSVTANDLELGFEQLEVDPVSSLVDRKLSESVIRSELNIVIVSIRRSNGEIIFNPSGETKIEGGDMLIAIGNEESLARLNALARGRATQQKAIEAQTR